MMPALQLGLDGRRPVELAQIAVGAYWHAVSTVDRALTTCGKKIKEHANRRIADRDDIGCAHCAKTRGARR